MMCSNSCPYPFWSIGMADGGLERQLLGFGLFRFLAHLKRRREVFLESKKHLVSKSCKSDSFIGSPLYQKHLIYIRTSCERENRLRSWARANVDLLSFCSIINFCILQQKEGPNHHRHDR